jgi:methylaspartate mutase sigma subunit
MLAAMNNRESIARRTLVLGVIGEDCHAVGNKILERVFSEAGFTVVNLGVMVRQEEFIAAAVETDARAIVVSSLYGHGEIDCRGLREKCIEQGIGDIIIYVGGNLVVGKRDFKETERTFRAMGFDRIFPPGTDPQEGVRALEEDLKARSTAAEAALARAGSGE